MFKIIVVLFSLLFSFFNPMVINDGPSDGLILFSPLADKTTYLVDYNGDVVHTWESDYYPGISVYMLENNIIMRSFNPFGHSVAGSGGGVQKISSEGVVLWEYFLEDAHHDIEVKSNGNVFMIASEHKTKSQVINAGRNPDFVNLFGMDIDYVVEVDPVTDSIVWEWHLWDHLVQDFDPNMSNYGNISDHPELVDININNNSIVDWCHINTVDYNPDFNQVMVSSRNLHEFYVIDYESGDIVYRWGNSLNYNDEGVKMVHGVHDAQWIKNGLDGEGNILLFNNGEGNDITGRSSVIEIVPPVDSQGVYELNENGLFGPSSVFWEYCSNGFFSRVMGGCQRLPNGNTLVCESDDGLFFEVNSDGILVWQYGNPFPFPMVQNMVFKGDWVENMLCFKPLDDWRITIKDVSNWEFIDSWDIVIGNISVQVFHNIDVWSILIGNGSANYYHNIDNWNIVIGNESSESIVLIDCWSISLQNKTKSISTDVVGFYKNFLTLF